MEQNFIKQSRINTNLSKFNIKYLKYLLFYFLLNTILIKSISIKIENLYVI